ncbi:MAG TPA: hypothetical protein VGK95_14330, partial [Caldimonas sp.]
MKSVIGALAGGVLALASGAAGAVAIVAATPQGEVAQVRQVTVRFSDAVVAFGDPRLPDPIAIVCQGSVPVGSGRWANDRVWLYDFREPLGPGTTCRATVRSDWKPAPKPSASASAVAGGAAALTGTTRFSFSTGGPAVVAIQPGGGNEIEEDQHFLLRLNGPAVETTAAAPALTGTTAFSFSTGGPAVVAIQPAGGDDIEEDQHFLLRLNGPAVEPT